MTPIPPQVWMPAPWFRAGQIFLTVLAVGCVVFTFLATRVQPDDALPADAFVRWAGVYLSGLALVLAALAGWLRGWLAPKGRPDRFGDLCMLAAVASLCLGAVAMAGAAQALSAPKNAVEGQSS